MSAATRREVLAFIALQDLSMPGFVSMVESLTASDPGGALSLKFFGPSAEADLNAWGDLLGAGEPRSYDDDPDPDDKDRRRNIFRSGTWRGRDLTLRAQVPLQSPSTPPEPLDEDTSAKLREIAGGDQ